MAIINRLFSPTLQLARGIASENPAGFFAYLT